MVRSHFAIRMVSPGTDVSARWRQRSSSIVFCNMCCPGHALSLPKGLCQGALLRAVGSGQSYAACTSQKSAWCGGRRLRYSAEHRQTPDRGQRGEGDSLPLLWRPDGLYPACFSSYTLSTDDGVGGSEYAFLIQNGANLFCLSARHFSL